MDKGIAVNEVYAYHWFIICQLSYTEVIAE